MEELVAWEYFGFHPNQLYEEVYAVGYNEFLTAISVLRDALLEEFPELQQQEEIQRGCSLLLASYSQKMDENWFRKFVDFCNRNVFTIPRLVRVYDKERIEDKKEEGEKKGKGEEEEKRDGRESGEEEVKDVTAGVELERVHSGILAVEYLNCKLQKRLGEAVREVGERRQLLSRVREEMKKMELVEAAVQLERELERMERNLTESGAES